MFRFGPIELEHLGHAGFRIKGDVIVYIDPYQIKDKPMDGDIVICTHDHFDHCSINDVKKVAKQDATIIAARNCSQHVKKLKMENILLNPGDEVTVKGVRVKAYPAYNVNKPFHPKSYGGIGVLVEVNGVRIYHAGDTDFIDEMKDLEGKVNIALLPVSGTYVMTAEEAAEAAKVIKPKVAIPMHYGVIVGSIEDAKRFKEKLSGVCEVVIL